MRQGRFLFYKHQSGERLRQYFVPVLVCLFIVGLGRTSKAESGLDQYGGTTSPRCPGGGKPQLYTEKIGNRWWLCDPAGNGFFLKGVYDIVANNNSTQTSFIQGKYAGPLSNWEANWALEQVHRLQAWGFNTVADY